MYEPAQSEINKIADSFRSMGGKELRNAIQFLQPVKDKEWRLISLLNYRLQIDNSTSSYLGHLSNGELRDRGIPVQHTGFFDYDCGGGRRVIWKTEPQS